jgi:hypothetical protein
MLAASRPGNIRAPHGLGQSAISQAQRVLALYDESVECGAARREGKQEGNRPFADDAHDDLPCSVVVGVTRTIMEREESPEALCIWIATTQFSIARTNENNSSA